MNKTIGIAMLITGVLLGISGVLVLVNPGMDKATEAFRTAMLTFLGGGGALFVAGMLLWQGVHIAPPGSLMTRRGGEHA